MYYVMKKRFFYAVILMLFVQVVNGQIFGIKGGVNIANMTISTTGMSMTPTSIVGLHIGPVADFKLQESLYFNTGILYSLKGASAAGATSTLNYLVIPLNLAYKFPMKSKSDFFIGAGPYLGYALSGKNKFNGQTEDITFGSGGMKRFDFGVGFGAGVELGSFLASLNYELGLANLVDDSSQDTKLKNKVFQISIGYLFGKAK
jgi:Outer membrane protein beta-barrel domain